ncbi:sensor domain-containing diguanylate cyclase [Vibrio furnissii]|uniref:sensor domain-containing diguanylate cyclase n=1 Tax=Vibrio furnissii TaxID=29494 RepID=UPI0012AE4808|nr:sensor domain-containing diguanylate cyclase [Vibrio furnissii]
MKDINRKYLSDIIIHSFTISLVAYLVTLIIFSESYLDRRNHEFENFVNVMEQYKQTLFLTSRILENKIQETDSIKKTDLSALKDIENRKYNLHKNLKPTNIDIELANEFQFLVSTMPAILPQVDVMYYRSYLSDMTSSDKDEVSVVKECGSDYVCTINAPERRLSDRILVSRVYHKKGSDNLYVTISSPVFLHNLIVGDLNIDVGLTRFFDLSQLGISSHVLNAVTFNELTYGNSLMDHIASTKEYIADNSTVYVYKVPFVWIVFRLMWLFVVMWVGVAYVIYLFRTLKMNRSKLFEVESNVKLDDLTGLLNRNVLKDQKFSEDLKAFGAAIMAIDGNKLKQINDTYGHHVGDDAIKQIAYGMRQVFRENDYLIRTGGDEFVAVLPGCNLDNAIILAERLKEAVMGTTFSSYKLNVSISVGITLLMNSETFEEALKRADSNLYSEKQSNPIHAQVSVV